MMTFIEVPSPGGPEAMRLGEMQVPHPRAGEVLIRVQAAGVNRPDIQQRKGAYPPPPGASPAAGEVAALGEGVTSLTVGARVTALCNGGAYAGYVTVPATQCLPWPAGYDAIRAAALPETYFTVWANLFMLGGLKAGETMLVHGGTSGIGITAIQMAVAIGATAFATAGSDEKCAAITRLGAHAINYKTQDFAEEIGKLTDKAGIDVVLDMVGAPYTPRNLACLKRGGRLVQIAFMQGSKAESFDLLPIMIKRLTVTGSTMRPRTAAEKGEIASALLQNIWPRLEAGAFAPVIDQVFPLAEVGAAHALMERSTHIGKIMLHIAD
jgi:NADPH2:quinone reductase